MDVSQYSRLEKGRVDIRFSTLCKVLKAMGLRRVE